jgi:hypothetical protein
MVSDDHRAWPGVDPLLDPSYARAMRRIVLSVVGVYLLFAVIGRFVEGMGAVTCGCRPDCWCKRPVLSTFRWVFPYGHRLQHDELMK